MVTRLVALSLFIAATAHAQAPGEMEGGGAPGMVAPVADTNPCGGCGGGSRNVMANRWAVGLSLGSISLAPQDSPDTTSEFAVAQLALRFRATLHLELEAAFGGGREKLADGTQGDRQLQTAALGLRYRFAPHANWNWWLMGALGSVSVASSQASNEDFKSAERPMGEFGIGLERRFNHFAVQAELRAIGVGEDPNRTKGEVILTGGPSGTRTMPGGPSGGMPLPPKDSLDNYSGGSFTVGGSYYF